MAKLNHAKIIKGFEELIKTTNGKDFFVGFLKTFGFPASTIRNVQDAKNGRNIAIAEGDYGLAKNLYFRPVTDGQDVGQVAKELSKNPVMTKQKVRFVLVTDFKRFVAYDAKVDDLIDIDFADLVLNYEFFLPITGLYEKPLAYTSHPADVKACEKMGKLYDIIRATNHYDDDNLHDLNVFLTRLLFCFFAEDTGIFPIEGQMTKAIESLTKADGSDMVDFFERLFWILDMEPTRYARTQETPTLAAFPYVNGGLFRDKIHIPTFNARARNILLECGRLEWNQISPVIFGSMFQAVMKPEDRHALGAHYTSEQNILKVIEPLFLDDLKAELASILSGIKDTQKKLTKEQTDKLYAFQGKLASLTFLDPACGSGNFLIVSFREIKRLEFEAVKALHKFDDTHERSLLDDWKLEASKVTIDQFYGIEIEEFPVEVARVSMWLMEHVMNVEFGKFFGATIPTIPLKDAAHIVCANALTTDWATVVPVERLSYIMGNPPFIGASLMSATQKSDVVSIFGPIKLAHSLDYVAAWYKKAAEIANERSVDVAFVSTNSITQGEQVGPLGGVLYGYKNFHINFAYRTFKWNNEAKGNAAVHCVIIGFGIKKSPKEEKKIFNGDGKCIKANNINWYLVDSLNVLVEPTSTPISSPVVMTLGNKPSDDGNLILTPEEASKLKETDLRTEKIIRRFVGAKDFLNQSDPRYCLWMTEQDAEQFKDNEEINARLNSVKLFRAKSSAAPTRDLASKPYRFFSTQQKGGSYLLVPRHSSQNRNYIPIGFMTEDVIAGDSVSIIQNARLTDFGILSSRMHMTWVRNIAGRLKSDYRYSGQVVFNTFPWPEIHELQKESIEVLAQKVLDARDLYPELTLADLYDPNKMPPELKKAHEQLDLAVDALYRPRGFESDEERLKMLFERYEKLAAKAIVEKAEAKKGKKK